MSGLEIACLAAAVALVASTGAIALVRWRRGVRRSWDAHTIVDIRSGEDWPVPTEGPDGVLRSRLEAGATYRVHSATGMPMVLVPAPGAVKGCTMDEDAR